MEKNAAHTFLDALFADKPERAAIQVWVRGNRPLTHTVISIDDAAKLAEVHGPQHDTYVGCGLAPNAEPKPTRTRLKAHEIVGIPGVWADIDVNGGPDAKAGAAPDMDSAIELAGALLQPTILVSSGYGLQAWWCWEGGPWMFERRADQEQAKRIVSGFQGALRAAARRAGWGLDATQDLARVMRIPGTYNHKGSDPAPVTIIEHSGSRYSYEEVGELGQGFLVANDQPRGEDTLKLDIRSGVPIDARVHELLSTEADFAALWGMSRGPGVKRRDWTASEFEFSITNWLVKAGLDPQHICDTLVWWRNIHEPGDPRRKLRPERIATTIGKVLRSIEVEERTAVMEQVRDEAVEVLENISLGYEKPTEAKTLGAFNRIIGGPEIARLKQYSRDPERARFVIELADGREVNLGTFDSISSQPAFRRAYGVITGYYPAAVGQTKWDKAVAGLLYAAVVEDDTEDSTVGQLAASIKDYLESHGGTDRNGACIGQGPFEEDHMIHLTLGHFTRWLKRVHGERVEPADVAVRLRVLGFSRRAVAYVTEAESGHRSTRSYFRGLRSNVERYLAAADENALYTDSLGENDQ